MMSDEDQQKKQQTGFGGELQSRISSSTAVRLLVANRWNMGVCVCVGGGSAQVGGATDMLGMTDLKVGVLFKDSFRLECPRLD